MASRTNKQWIANKKKQQEKMKKLKWTSTKLNTKNLSGKEKSERWLVREIENPKWKKYTRDLAGRKTMCEYTGLREDPDGYRLVWKPNSSEHDFVLVGITSSLRRKLNKMKK